MSYETAILTRLRARLDNLKGNSAEIIVSGRCADYSQYRYSCGYLKALDDAMVLAEEVAKEIQGVT